jgi:hypothetical protein
MNTKNPTLIITLAVAITLGTINLNAAEPVLSPKAQANQIKRVQITTADPNLLACNREVIASPKVLADFSQVAQCHKAQSGKLIGVGACCDTMGTCACCDAMGAGACCDAMGACACCDTTGACVCCDATGACACCDATGASACCKP